MDIFPLGVKKIIARCEDSRYTEGS